MNYMWFVLVYCLNCVLSQQNEENESCRLETGETGICKTIANCLSAQDLLRNGKRPQLCGFSNLLPIVCCVTDIKKKGPNATSSSNTKLTMTSATVGALSRKKCLDYYPKPKYPVLINGGQKSLAREFPHMAIIGFGEKDNIQWQCGGSLISINFVLTAAHCLNSRNMGPARWVRGGDLDLSTDQDDAYPEDFTVIGTIAHPLYKAPMRYHDIGLIQLDRNVALSAYVSPACLNTDREFMTDKVTATGWGRTGFSGNSSSYLLKVDLDHVPYEKCKGTFTHVSPILIPNGIVDDWHICAGGNIGQDTCQGDSGGPLQVPNKNRTYLVQVHTIIGVTSFGKTCGLSKSPGIYTRVSHYIPWIESVVWPNES